MHQVLVVDDEVAMRTALEAAFTRDGWKVLTAAGAREALTKFRAAPCPLVITDMRMPDGDGLQVLQDVRRLAPETAVVFLTAFGSIPEAVQTMREGACDYLVKPVSFDQLRQTARRLLEQVQLQRPRVGDPEIVGRSPVLLQALERLKQAAASDADILIEAESGTGKELAARLVHRLSARRAGPFVAVNCAALPETLLEAELFGYTRGAFTGAVAPRPGKFEQADGGTLLLDEIGEMPLSLQPKLLRVLQEREVDRLGSQRPVAVNVRVIATTNRSLRELVARERFRADLYYRLNVIPVRLPPLRERREDIALLAVHFLQKYAGSSRWPQVELSTELQQRMLAYDWPGNVRELENFIRRALVLAPAPRLGPELLDELLLPAPGTETAEVVPVTLREMERRLLARTLEATGGNRTRTAELLGISIRTVRNKIRAYGLEDRRVS